LPRKDTARIPRVSRRTGIVWTSFAVSMAIVSGVLALGDRGAVPGFAAAKASFLAEFAGEDPVFQTETPLDGSRWKSIVIHHSGEPAGDAESIRRAHLAGGARALGYHFVIGNGNGLGDGAVFVGERWDGQAAGWHAVGPEAAWYNRHAIAICLVGNGDRRPFTERQVQQLVSLVRRLQRQLGIPSSAVRLHRDIAPTLTTSPGRHFPTASLEQQLLAPLR
jgi:N-acetyl-anhydromuramyl-L-alanine amidase AmpD